MEQTSISRIQSSLVFLTSIVFHLLLLLITSTEPLLLHIDLLSFFSKDRIFTADHLLSSGQGEPHISFSFTYEDDFAEDPFTQDTDDTGKTRFEPKGASDVPLEEHEDATTILAQETSIRPPINRQTAQPEAIHSVPVSAQNLTLADITRGFLKSAQQHAGHNRAAQEMKQMALQVYATKVWNIIKTAFLAGDCCLHLRHAVNVQTELLATIDREGKLVGIQLVYPKHITQLQDIEELIISRAQQAGLFPPLPKEIAGQTKRFSFPLLIEAEPGLHSYSLSYR